MADLSAFAGKYQLERVENLAAFLAQLNLPPPAIQAASAAPKGGLDIAVDGDKVTLSASMSALASKPYTLVVGGEPQEMDFMGLIKTKSTTTFADGKLVADLAAPHQGGPANGKPIKVTLELKDAELFHTSEINGVTLQQVFKKQ